MNKIKKKVNEFCIEANLENFREVLVDIFSRIEENNCWISARYDAGPSIHEFPNDTGRCMIRIPINQFKDKPIKIIWTILHEFGHHISGRFDKNNASAPGFIIQREISAWEYARSYIIENEHLRDQIDEFNIYADSCLNTYIEREQGRYPI